MSRKLRQLSGKDVIKIFQSFGFSVEKQRGSHIKLSRQSQTGEKEVLGVPDHKKLAKGTCKAIFNQASRYVSADELTPYFYSDDQ